MHASASAIGSETDLKLPVIAAAEILCTASKAFKI